MSCNCVSYNLDGDGRSEVPLAPPAWADRDRPVLVDACIAHVLPAVWARGQWTLGSCCGHGDRPPALVLSDTAAPAVVAEAIRSVDSRRWELFQWQLVDVSVDPGEVVTL